jgi:hypothetical protein
MMIYMHIQGEILLANSLLSGILNYRMFACPEVDQRQL